LDIVLDASCVHCGKYFCVECRLPEKHECEPLPHLMAAINISNNQGNTEKPVKKNIIDYFGKKNEVQPIQPLKQKPQELKETGSAIGPTIGIESWHARKLIPATTKWKKSYKKPWKGKNKLVIGGTLDNPNLLQKQTHQERRDHYDSNTATAADEEESKSLAKGNKKNNNTNKKTKL